MTNSANIDASSGPGSRVRTFELAEPRKAAQEVAEQIAAAAPGVVVGVCLGGGLTYRTWIDNTSDIDLFCYLEGDLPDLTSWTRLVAGGDLVHQARSRGSLLEFRRHVGPHDPHTGVGRFDVNIKAIPFATIASAVRSRPTFDEITLEDLHSYAYFEVMADQEGRLRQVLADLERATPGHVARLAAIALETYGKELSGAIKQRLFRDDVDGGAMQPTFAKLAVDAMNALVCLGYLQAGVYPAPFKWRLHEDFLRALPRGIEINEILVTWSRKHDALAPETILPTIRALEGHIADFTRPPWQRHSDDRWWWVNFDPITMRREAISPYAGRRTQVGGAIDPDRDHQDDRGYGPPH